MYKCESTTEFEFRYAVTAFYFSLRIRNVPGLPLFEFMYLRNFTTHNFIFLWSGIYSVNNTYLFHLIWKDQGKISVLLLPRTKKSNCKTLSWLIDVSFIEEIPLCNQERAEICLVDYFERPFLDATGATEYQNSWWGQVYYVVDIICLPLITIRSNYLTKMVGDESPRPHTFRQPCAKGQEISKEFFLSSISTKNQWFFFSQFFPVVSKNW